MGAKHSIKKKLSSSPHNSIETQMSVGLKEIPEVEGMALQFNIMNLMENHFNSTSSDIEISEELKQISQKLNTDDFKTLKLLGRGMFGKVLLVEHIPTGKYYALKSLNKNKIIKLLQVEHTKSERK
jgi:hypothetical protein